jgi:uncharacterized protein (TIGR02646 family)
LAFHWDKKGLVVIPVTPQPEPKDFDVKVRQKGVKWFASKRIDTDKPLPKKVKPSPFWTECIPELRASYNHICAYVCIRIEPITGFATVEHFKPKSKYPKLVYEWSNYLLVCGVMNGHKSDYEDVLDPFLLSPNTFWLNLMDGKIRPNPNSSDTRAALQTIKRLKLDSSECNKLRLHYWDKYIRGQIDQAMLQEYSPFVYLEAQRQDQL